MKMIRTALAAAFLLACVPAFAQWQTPNHSVPIGKGVGVTGFGSAVPSTSGQPLVSQGASADPAFGTIANSGFTPGAANTAKGSLNGSTVVDLPLPSCTGVGQAVRYTSGVGFSCGSVSVTTGYDMPINLGLSASATGNALTITLTQASGSAPTGGNPVLIPFRSTMLTNGTVTWDTVSATQSIVVPSGATLGTSSGVPFRVWVFEEHNGGTPELAVATCSNATAIFPCATWETSLPTSTTIGGGSGSGGTLYATAGVAADAVRIVGYCEFANGLVTAGTWASSCTSLQVFGPGIKKPGDVVQTAFGSNTGGSLSGSTKSQGASASITPTSAINPIRVSASVGLVASQASASQSYAAQISRGSGPTLIGPQLQGGVNGFSFSTSTTISGGGGLLVYDADQSSAVTYYVYCWSPSGNGSSFGSNYIEAMEIMG